jgi:hypothetical protein
MRRAERERMEARESSPERIRLDEFYLPLPVLSLTSPLRSPLLFPIPITIFRNTKQAMLANVEEARVSF